MSPAKIILIPGLGADRDLFYPQKNHFGEQLQVVECPGDHAVWQERPSMSTAAEAFLEQILLLLPENGNFVLGGMSFGGSLVMEIACRMMDKSRCRPPSALALIASNRTSDSIARSFRVNRVIGSILPRWAGRCSLRVLSGVFARREGLAVEQKDRLREMADRANLDQLLWGAQAIANWSFSDEHASTIELPIHQIHGARDWVIPVSSRHVTESLEDARHLISWTHPEAVNAWLQRLVEYE